MANIIEFPNKRVKDRDEISLISKKAAVELFAVLQRHNVQTRNTAFLRDLAIIRKFIEAALLRQIGDENVCTRILDEMFESLPPY